MTVQELINILEHFPSTMVVCAEGEKTSDYQIFSATETECRETTIYAKNIKPGDKIIMLS